MFDVCLVTDTGRWEDQWSYVLSHWQPRTVYLIGEIDPKINPFKDAVSIASAEELPTDIPLIAMQPDTARYVFPSVSIADFEHPAECIYLFGNDHSHLCDDQCGTRVADTVVSIPTDTHDEMYSWVAGAVTLFDRKVRNG